MKEVSGAIFEWVVTPLSLFLSESTGAMSADKSMGQLLKQFR